MSYYTEVTESVKNYIESNIENDITPDDTAKAANYSLKQLNRIFILVTGLSISEYIRWKKLSKALFELKYKDEIPVIDIAIKYGYESQEAFTRAFKDNFSITPGEYRKTKRDVSAKNWHINQFIHQTAHEFLGKGIYKRGNVDSWIVVKPDRVWVSARKNTNNLHPSEFYNFENDELVKRAFALPDIVGGGGAYFPSENHSGLSFGVEVENDYPLDSLKGFEIIRIPQSKYVVFNYPKYPIENHGDAIYSTWHAQKDYDIAAQNMTWSLDKLPVFEDDSEETGYTLWFPVTDKIKGV